MMIALKFSNDCIIPNQIKIPQSYHKLLYWNPHYTTTWNEAMWIRGVWLLLLVAGPMRELFTYSCSVAAQRRAPKASKVKSLPMEILVKTYCWAVSVIALRLECCKASFSKRYKCWYVNSDDDEIITDLAGMRNVSITQMESFFYN